jgi:hypothetical protein
LFNSKAKYKKLYFSFKRFKKAILMEDLLFLPNYIYVSFFK